MADRAAGRVQDAYGRARDKARDASRDATEGLIDKVEDYGDQLIGTIGARPITSVLIAAGLGYLLAMATRSVPKVVTRPR